MGFGDFIGGLAKSLTGGDVLSGALQLGGGIASAITGKQSNDREYERQKEFAQNGLRWKVADAKAAGIHPIFAVGANTPTYSPQAAVGTDFGLSSVGQNIGRAIEAGQTRAEREQAFNLQTRMGDAQIALIDAQTDYYRALADRNSPASLALDEIGRQANGSMLALRSQSDQRSKPFPTTVDPKDGVWGKTMPELARVQAPDGRISALVISTELHDAVEDIHLFEMVPYISNGIQVGWKIIGAKKDGAEFYGYRWHDATKQWIKNPNWRMQKPLTYDEAFNRHGYGYSKDRKSYHGRIR